MLFALSSLALAGEWTTAAPVTDLVIHQGKPVWLTKDGRFEAGERSGDGAKHLARAGDRWSTVTSDGFQTQLDGEAVARMVTIYDLAGDGADVVAVGLDNNAPSGRTYGWVLSKGANAWESRAQGAGYAHFTGVVLGASQVIAVGASDHGGRRYAPWVVGFDRKTGAQALELHGSLPGWSALIDVVPARDGSFTAVGHTAPNQPAMMPSATPFLWQVDAAGKASDPVVLESSVLVNVEAAAGSASELWLVATALAPGATPRDGPYLGALGRSDGKKVVWKAVPGCRPATQLAVEGKTLWLAGHDGRRNAGWVASYQPSDFDGWKPVESCNTAPPP